MWRRGVPIEEVKKEGRLSLLTDTVWRSIIAQVQSNKFATSKDIAQAIQADISVTVTDQTVRNHLSKLLYQNSVLRIVPFITVLQKEKRVQWAQDHRNFDWSNVFFSDETMIQLSANITRTWHKTGSRPNVPRPKFPLKVMFWGAVSASR
jgi:hypothetical protein